MFHYFVGNAARIFSDVAHQHVFPTARLRSNLIGTVARNPFLRINGVSVQKWIRLNNELLNGRTFRGSEVFIFGMEEKSAESAEDLRIFLDGSRCPVQQFQLLVHRHLERIFRSEEHTSEL